MSRSRRSHLMSGVAADHAGGGTRRVQQDPVELLVTAPLLWGAAIAQFNFGVQTQALQVFFHPRQALFVDIDRHDVRFRRRFQNMRGFSAGRGAQVEDLFAVLRIQQIDTPLG